MKVTYLYSTTIALALIAASPMATADNCSATAATTPILSDREGENGTMTFVVPTEIAKAGAPRRQRQDSGNLKARGRTLRRIPLQRTMDR